VLTEDEDIVRDATVMALRSLGYDVLAAANGNEALRLARESRRHIDLLLTDVVMPQMSGPELAAQFTRLFPEVRVLFMSGYTENLAERSILLESEGNFLQKPFTSAILAHKVRDVLDAVTYVPAHL
jgi:CheY-like chemotaxis protein